MKKHMLISLLFIFMLASAYSQTNNNITTYVIEDNSIMAKDYIKLDTEWDFFWGKFIPYSDNKTKPDLRVKVPSNWNNYELQPEAHEIAKTGRGAGTYRIHLENLKPNTSYAFPTFDLFFTACEVYANDDLIYKAGNVDVNWKNSKGQQYFDYAVFETDYTGTITLTVFVSNNYYRKAGFNASLKLQENSSYEDSLISSISFYGLLCGILITISIYAFLLFILKKDKANLYLSIFVFLIFLRIISQAFAFLKFFIPEFPHSFLLKIEFLAVFFAPAIYTLYVNALNKDIFKHLKAWILALPGFIILPLDLFLPISLANKLVPIMQGYMFFIVITDIVLILINIIRHKNFISLTSLISVFIIGIGAGTEILSNNHLTALKGISLLTLSFIIYAISQITLLAYIQNRNLIKVNELNAHLTEVNKAYYRFVPKEFLDLFRKKDITEIQLGEWKSQKMAILSADIRNFTSISEKMNEMQVFDMLNSYLRKVAPTIRKYKGIIEKYLGDGIIAIFPGDADTALNCAIEMQEEMIDLRKEFMQKGLPDIKIGIGVHYGDVIIGTGGDSDRMTEISLSNDIDVAVKAEAATKIYKKPIIVTHQALASAASVEKKLGKKFDFYGEKICVKDDTAFYAIYSDKTGKEL
ncbi:MAG: adenylate/guanylate cyclase domain-containing protein [Treponema sp.]|nr:adenylate/guanylate cyclase domain-containing protein [Treponema sp.]